MSSNRTTFDKIQRVIGFAFLLDEKKWGEDVNPSKRFKLQLLFHNAFVVLIICLSIFLYIHKIMDIQLPALIEFDLIHERILGAPPPLISTLFLISIGLMIISSISMALVEFFYIKNIHSMWKKPRIQIIYHAPTILFKIFLATTRMLKFIWGFTISTILTILFSVLMIVGTWVLAAKILYPITNGSENIFVFLIQAFVIAEGLSWSSLFLYLCILIYLPDNRPPLKTTDPIEEIN